MLIYYHAAELSSPSDAGVGDRPPLSITPLVHPEPVTDPRDRALLERLLQNHAVATGSARATALLKDWPTAAERFVKIIPEEYQAVVVAAASRGEDLRMPLPPALTAAPESPAHQPRLRDRA